MRSNHSSRVMGRRPRGRCRKSGRLNRLLSSLMCCKRAAINGLTCLSRRWFLSRKSNSTSIESNAYSSSSSGQCITEARRHKLRKGNGRPVAGGELARVNFFGSDGRFILKIAHSNRDIIATDASKFTGRWNGSQEPVVRNVRIWRRMQPERQAPD